ncbi:MAG: prepilin-type N-terminal cleavage/methylation domain-containing protein [Candidatus Electrothrix sp. AUS4]|nr:prepilin-type N-terminal cleavage/methylation domain-containing protein [Candidatus Electrothrix sp. AUS4]
MKSNKSDRLRQDGFTLIETMMAMVIFTIGILGLFGMQTAAIKENLTANSITGGSAWAMNQVEQLLNLSYDDPLLEVNAVCSDLSDDQIPQAIEKAKSKTPFPYTDSSGNVEPIYNIYWVVARGCTLKDVSSPAGTPEDENYNPKHLRIIVTRQMSDEEKEFAVFNYIKQNVL